MVIQISVTELKSLNAVEKKFNINLFFAVFITHFHETFIEQT